jgi:hypothetical protein
MSHIKIFNSGNYMLQKKIVETINIVYYVMILLARNPVA